MELSKLAGAERLALQKDFQARFDKIKAAGLSLDLTRGKPCSEQLDLSRDLDGILQGFYLLQDGTDVRNYGGILGIPEARKFGADMLGISADETMAGGNSSLLLMYCYMDLAYNQGAAASDSAWSKEAQAAGSKVKFLCPVPGYDRHFSICEHLDIEMITVPMGETGPDMELIENLVERDPLIKGIWCVPKYSNPTGHTYSDETVKRLAKLPSRAGKNFRVMWDNAYVVHHLSDQPDQLLNIMHECKKEGTEDNLVIFASTSKITFAGAGVAFCGTSASNLSVFEKFLSTAIIGFDKVNQLRHVRFLKDRDGLLSHMNKHKNLLMPKFELVETILDKNLGGKKIASWSKPRGGYFVSLDTLNGLASETVKLAAEAGVKLTPAGATYPYGLDPDDKNIRIAPTFPNEDQLRQALEVLVLCIQLVSINHSLKH